MHGDKKKMMGGGYNKYSKGGKANGNKMARREYSKGGSVNGAMKTAKPC
jgi:hypothetical protein